MTTNIADEQRNGTRTQSGLRRTCEPDARAWVRDMLESTADKWTILVIEALSGGTLRFTALQAEVAGISHRMLTRTLRSLERNGMITRTAYAEVPPRVDYALTPLGRTLIEPVDAFIHWAEEHRSVIDDNRVRFDAR
jgi:DNA-binding HxlR family transcriptional regulator